MGRCNRLPGVRGRRGALLREANTQDVWLFVNPEEIRALWPHLIHYLGPSRDMWAWLLKLPPPDWPPLSEIRAVPG